MKQHQAGGTDKSHVNSLPRWKAVMQRVRTWTQMAQLTFLKWNSLILHIKCIISEGMACTHSLTHSVPEVDLGSLLLCKVLCEELSKEQSYVKKSLYHSYVSQKWQWKNAAQVDSSDLLQGTKKALQPHWRIAGISVLKWFHASICTQCCMIFEELH